MKKRGLLSLLLGKSPPAAPRVELFGQDLGQWGQIQAVYQSDIARKAIDRIASQAAKMRPVHIRVMSDGRRVRKDSPVERLLARRPNPYMSGYDFLYQVVSLLYLDNNVFVLPVRELGAVTAFYPIHAANTELLEDAQKNVWVRFSMRDGNTYTLQYGDLIHLRRFFAGGELAGDADQRGILHAVQTAQTALDGVSNAIQTSSRVLGLLKMPTALKPEDKNRQLEELTGYLEQAAAHGGFIPSDIKADVQPLTLDPKMAQRPLLEALTARVYSYYGVSEAIVAGDYSEQQYNAFYETVLEPLSLQLSQAFSQALFGERSREQLVFETSYLFYTSWTTKITLLDRLTPMGHLSINEGRELLGLPPREGGDLYVQSLNYVDQSKANEYQGVEGGEGNGDQTGNPDGGAAGAAAGTGDE